MLGVENPCFYFAISSAFQVDRPLSSGFVPGGFGDAGLRPNIQLQQLCVRLEPVTDLVFWGKDWPRIWERHIWEMIEPNGIVKNELMVSHPPVVSNSVFSVDYQRLDAQHLESRCSGEASLPSTWVMLVT
jgi:hypothetical protein